ncbi:MAG: elongation factor P maturation arginine rhamnosyltransferase EarP [Rhodoferax sp.]
MKAGKLWNIFCRVIDNYGDIGVCWRLAADLAARGEKVRLWVDDASALGWMAPDGAPGVEVRLWTPGAALAGMAMGDVLLEAFGCQIDPEFLAAFAQRAAATGQQGLWINLEYLSAEAYVERCHGLPSPVQAGPGAGLKKHFFYPGFTEATGGLLREPGLATRRAAFDREAWLRAKAIDHGGERLVSLFCYDPPALGELLDQLAADPLPSRLLVTPGLPATALSSWLKRKDSQSPGWNRGQRLLLSYLPLMTQLEFDGLLWSCDLNFVRGEDSLVRALWADRPFVWQPYAQTDNAHQGKLQALLERLDAPTSLRAFHLAWNGFSRTALPAIALAEWQQAASRARARQLQQTDLVTRILRFALKNH